MNRSLVWLGYAFVLLAVYRVSHSTSGFLLTGLGLIALVDRYAFRHQFRAPGSWRRDVAIRGVTFLAGTAVFFVLRPGIVPMCEATYRGFMTCLTGVLLERVAGPLRPWWRWVVAGIIVGLIPWCVALHPLRTVPKRTPAALGLAFEDVRMRSSDGTRLAAWVIPHPRARGNAIYCHGHGRNRGQGAALFKTLHGLGLNVLAFDFRGHGDSDGHTSTFGAREVEDLLAAADYCRTRFPGQPLFLVGISMGSAVTLQALQAIPDVCGVWSEAAFSRFSATVERQFATLPEPLRRPLVEGCYLLGWLDCGFRASSINPVDHLAGLTVPICFCHGEKDRLVPCDQGRELYEAYPGPKTSWWVAGASHANIRQRNSDEYRKRFEAFVESCLPADR
jgi:alpha-beta hydrolase superfamily lysophospholipase